MHNWVRRSAFAAVVISCAFTGYFGWITGGEDTFAQFFNACAGVLISASVAIFFWLVAVCEVRRLRIAMYAFGGFGVLFGMLDAGSNVGAIFAMREAAIIKANHTTMVAQDVRAQVVRLRAEDAKLAKIVGEPGAWLAAKDAEAAYQRLVDARDREAARGHCGPKCEALDKEARALKLEIGKIRAREDAIARRDEVQKELAEAEARAVETPPVVSPVETIKAKLASVFSMDLEPSQAVRELTYLGITFLFGVGLTLLSGALSYGATILAPHHANEHDSWAHRQAIPAAPAYQPVPLQSEPAPAPVARSSHSETVTTYSYSGHEAPSASQRLRELIEHHQRQAAALRGQT